MKLLCLGGDLEVLRFYTSKHVSSTCRNQITPCSSKQARWITHQLSDIYIYIYIIMSDPAQICVQHACIEICCQCLKYSLWRSNSGLLSGEPQVKLDKKLKCFSDVWKCAFNPFFLLLFLTFISPLPPSFPPYSRSPSSSLSFIRVSCSPDRTSVETNTLTAMAGQSDFSSPSSSSGVQTQQIKARSQTCFYLAQNHVILKICSK